MDVILTIIMEYVREPRLLMAQTCRAFTLRAFTTLVSDALGVGRRFKLL